MNCIAITVSPTDLTVTSEHTELCLSANSGTSTTSESPCNNHNQSTSESFNTIPQSNTLEELKTYHIGGINRRLKNKHFTLRPQTIKIQPTNQISKNIRAVSYTHRDSHVQNPIS